MHCHMNVKDCWYLHWSDKLKETWSEFFIIIPNYVMTNLLFCIICYNMYILLIDCSLSLWLPITVRLEKSMLANDDIRH